MHHQRDTNLKTQSQVDVADLDAMIDCPQLDETVLH